MTIVVTQSGHRNDGAKGCDQECRHVRGHAAGQLRGFRSAFSNVARLLTTSLNDFQDAVECATQAMEKFNVEKDIAAYIKKEFDKKYNPTWHCIVGRDFGSYVTHETKHFVYFYLGKVAVLLFKSG